MPRSVQSYEERIGRLFSVFLDDRFLVQLLVEKQAEHRDEDVIGRTRDGVRSDHIEGDEADDDGFDDVGVVDLLEKFVDDKVKIHV